MFFLESVLNTLLFKLTLYLKSYEKVLLLENC